MTRCARILCILMLASSAPADEQHFESRVRPLLIERCLKCHAATDAKGGLRLDSREAILKGGDTGPAIVPGNPDASLLIQAVQHQNGLQMPPDGKLSAVQVEALSTWIRDGAVWPGTPALDAGASVEPTSIPASLRPNEVSAADSLQFWLRADALELTDGEPVHVWPDQSRHGRDVSATKGVRAGGTGGPASYVRTSSLAGRPAVRFSSTTGLASSPGNPVAIQGDAAFTMTLVVNITPFEGQPAHLSIFGVGDPASGGDPGKPLAALIEIDQTQQYSLDLAGGWGHDAILAPGSFQPLFGKPVILTIIRKPGPIRETTQFFINGKRVDGSRDSASDSAVPGSTDPLAASGSSPAAPQDVPDIRHRNDMGVFLGKALSWCGEFQGDVGEVVLFNTALSDVDRMSLELHLGEKFGLFVDEERTVAPKAVFTDAEKSHWAYQPVQRISLPLVSDEAWIRTPVDRFTLAMLESHSLTPSPEVDKRTFLRRVTFDLTGLPPSPEELDAFLADESPQAFETVVDRLLNSGHYGERWGRHWLDLVRYGESTANDANAVMGHAWRYRNYVIDAINQDLPYDQFLIEQLAGDLLPPTDSVQINTRRLIATGYLMVGPKALAETDKEQSRLDIVDDQIDVTGRAMLGLTLACARCHDHKFDAVRTTDYYALAGIFRSTEPFQNEARNATMWWEFPVSQGPGVEPIVVMAPKEAQPRNLRVHLRGNRFTLGKVVPRGTLGIVESTVGQGDLKVSVDPHQPASGRLELARWIASPVNPLTARVLVNRVWQLHFGRGIVGTPDNFGTRGELPTDPHLLDWLATQFIDDGWSLRKLHRLIVLSSTYRMQNEKTAPLSGSDSGSSRGVQEPSNHKAAEIETAVAALQVRRRRLSAEELRDAMLFTSGQLDAAPGASESGDFLISRSEDINAMIRPNRVGADDEFYTTFRKRSVYLPIVRNMLPDILALFDAADPNGVTAVRNETTVASQGLFLLNHPFVLQQSRAFAERLLADSQLTDEQRIELAHRLALGRSATVMEIQETTDFLRVFVESPSPGETSANERRLAAWRSFCQSLLCSNEFLYVE